MNTPLTIAPESATNIKGHLTGLLATLFGFIAGLFTKMQPLLSGAFGQLLDAGIPIAEQLVLDIITKGGKLDNATRDHAAQQLMNVLKAKGVSTAIAITEGLAKYILDTAYHTLKQGNKLPTPQLKGTGPTAS